ncbi:MAG: branched-chain amino acid ABC transporter permease [Candidatus Poribacteria bacterium]|nr:branched-chain amino acid ABC transporter permease [Candidatus Poribacteria bacterium]
MDQFYQQLINGIVLGGIYALIAVGYTMVYGIIQLINFAHGEIFMLGAYFAFTLVNFTPIPFWVAIFVSMLFCAGVGMLMDYVAYRPLRNAPRLSALITAIGVSIGLQNLARILWGAKPQTFTDDTLPTIFQQISPMKEPKVFFSIFGVTFTDAAIQFSENVSLAYLDLTIIVLAIILMVSLNRLVSLTKIGKAMRACAQNRIAANLMGVRTNQVIAITFAIGSALGAVAGVMVGVRDNIGPTMGLHKGVAAFAAAVLGGIGNITGAMVGGLLMGLAEVFGAGYIDPMIATICHTIGLGEFYDSEKISHSYGSGYRIAISYIVMIIVILIRPTGLFGKASAHRA